MLSHISFDNLKCVSASDVGTTKIDDKPTEFSLCEYIA